MLKISKDCKLGIGIDFGNTNFRVGIYCDDHFECIPDEFGNFSTPSYLYINENDEKVIGFAAKQQVIKNPQNILCHIKELIGKTAQQLSENKDLLLQNIKIESSSSPLFVFQNTPLRYKIEEIIAIFFAKFKSFAEQFLENSRSINDVVITVPTVFGDIERLIIKDAARVAGFAGNIRLFRDPVVACLAYNPTTMSNSDLENIFIFDLGGSHLGLSIFSFEEGCYEQVIASEYDLGGKDFDHKLMEYCITHLLKNADIKNNTSVMKKLEDHCEKAKKDLTSSLETHIEVENYVCQITRSKFEELSSDLFQQIALHIEQLLKQSGLRIQQLNKVIITGGASKIPKIPEIVKNYFKGVKIHNTIDPEIVGIYGAAIQAEIMSSNKPVELACRIDFTLLPMGVEVAGGFMPMLINRGTAFELQKKYVFTTSEENQTSVLVNLFEGYSPIAKENHHLATVILDNISPAPRGVAKIELTIKIDADDILKLIVTEIDTGKSSEFAVPYYDAKWGIEGVEKCLKDAETRTDEYKEIRERMEALSDLENWVYHIRNTVNRIESAKEIERICCQEVIGWIKEKANLQKEDYQKKLEMVQEIFHNFMKQSGHTDDDENLVLPRGLPSLSPL